MTTLEGVDYSGTYPGGAALKAAGKAFVARYVPYGKSRTGGNWGLSADYAKCLDKPELDNLKAYGIAVVLVFESVANRALATVTTVTDLDYAAVHHLRQPTDVTPYQAGQADAWQSQTALGELGLPDMPIYFAVDFDTTTTTQRAAIDSYLKGAASIIGLSRVGVYGEYEVMAHCKVAGTASYFWQTYAWSGGKIFAGNHLYQYRNHVPLNGVYVDLDRAYPTDYGQYPQLLPETSTEDPNMAAPTWYGQIKPYPSSRVTIPAGQPTRTDPSISAGNIYSANTAGYEFVCTMQVAGDPYYGVTQYLVYPRADGGFACVNAKQIPAENIVPVGDCQALKDQVADLSAKLKTANGRITVIKGKVAVTAADIADD